MKIKTVLHVIEYAIIVQDMAKGYFDTTGEYQPYIGRVNDMRLFWNYCVSDTEFDDEIGHEVSNPIDLESVFANKEFIEAYTEATRPSVEHLGGLNFYNAFWDAQAIVSENLKPTNRIRVLIDDFMNKVSDTLNPEVLEAIKSISGELSSDKNLADIIADSYQNSEHFNNVINMSDARPGEDLLKE